MGYPDWGFNFNYWTIVVSLQCEKYAHEWESNLKDSSIKFYPFEYGSFFKFNNACPINLYATGHPENPTNFNPPNPPYNLEASPNFSNHPDFVFAGHNTVYAMIQIARILGFKEIYLLGVDHRFSLPEKDERKGIWKDANSSSHFHPGYTAKRGEKREFHLPNVDAATRFFNFAEEVSTSCEMKIINLTENSALKSFQTDKFDNVI